MTEKDNILKLIEEEETTATKLAKRGLILQPGAIGDCILTLPLARFMKEHVVLGGVNILGSTEYIGILPGRTCVDGVRSKDSVSLHRLFVETKNFDIADKDPLLNLFVDYTWIVTFMGEPNSDFEQNLIFAVNCVRSAEVVTLSAKPPEEFSGHITDFYIQQFAEQSGRFQQVPKTSHDRSFIKATKTDILRGKELLSEMNIDTNKKLILIHPGSGGAEKCCHLENFLTVANELQLRDMEVIFLLGPAEMERFSEEDIIEINTIANCSTDLSLADALAMLSCADGFIGNDSGVTHLAASLGIKTVALFGPTNPDIYRPIGPNVTIIATNNKSFAKKPSSKLQQNILKNFKF